MKTLLLVTALVLCACTPAPTPQAIPGIFGDVYDFKMPDGTRCIAWKLGYGGGLSCDFTTAKRAQR